MERSHSAHRMPDHGARRLEQGPANCCNVGAQHFRGTRWWYIDGFTGPTLVEYGDAAFLSQRPPVSSPKLPLRFRFAELENHRSPPSVIRAAARSQDDGGPALRAYQPTGETRAILASDFVSLRVLVGRTYVQQP